MSAEKDVDREVLSAFFPDPAFKGVFIEVGAARPDYLSISAGFRRQGWKVVAVEPNPDFCAAHRAAGHEVLEYAASDTEQDDAEFFVVDSQGIDYLGGNVSFESFSSLGIRDEFAKLHETIKDKTNVRSVRVKVRKLDTILAQHEPDISHVDVIAVDVEGWELNVMRGFSTQKFNPQVVILENLFKSDDYVSYMKGVGYQLWRRLEPNDVFVRNDLAPADSMSRKGALGQLMDRLVGRK